MSVLSLALVRSRFFLVSVLLFVVHFITVTTAVSVRGRVKAPWYSKYDETNPPQYLQPPWASAPGMSEVPLPAAPKPMAPPPPPAQGFQGAGRFSPPPPPPPPSPPPPLPPPPPAPSAQFSAFAPGGAGSPNGGGGMQFKAEAGGSHIKQASSNEHYPKFKRIRSQVAPASNAVLGKDSKISQKIDTKAKAQPKSKSLKDRFAAFNTLASRLKKIQVQRENAHVDIVAPPRFKRFSETLVSISKTKTGRHLGAPGGVYKRSVHGADQQVRFAAYNKLVEKLNHKHTVSVVPVKQKLVHATLGVENLVEIGEKPEHPVAKEQKDRFAMFNTLAKKLSQHPNVPVSALTPLIVHDKSKIVPVAPSANAFYKKYSVRSMAVKAKSGATVPRFSTVHANSKAQLGANDRARLQSSGAGMMTFETYDPNNPPPWLAPPWNHSPQQIAGNNVNAMPRGQYAGGLLPATQNSMAPNGGAPFGTNGAPGVPFAYAPLGAAQRQPQYAGQTPMPFPGNLVQPGRPAGQLIQSGGGRLV